MCVILQVGKQVSVCGECQSWELWKGCFCPIFKCVYAYLAFLHLQNQFLVVSKKKRNYPCFNVRDARTSSLQLQGECNSLRRAVYWRAVPFPRTLKSESKAKMTLWGQWQINLPSCSYRWSLILRKTRAASCAWALLLCLSPIYTLENEDCCEF